MNEENGQFRTAAFGGFHRQDVLDYIARSTELSSAKIWSLQEQVEQLRKSGEESAQALEALRAEHEAVVQARDAAQARAESGQLEQERLRQEVETLRREAAELRMTVARLQPEVEAMERLKHQLVDIELEARARGEEIVRRAEGEAQAIRQSAARTIGNTRQSFDAARTDVESTISHMSRELERLLATLAGMTTAFDRDGEAIAALSAEEEQP